MLIPNNNPNLYSFVGMHSSGTPLLTPIMYFKIVDDEDRTEPIDAVAIDINGKFAGIVYDKATGFLHPYGQRKAMTLDEFIVWQEDRQENGVFTN